jgi:hypothetical protein
MHVEAERSEPWLQFDALRSIPTPAPDDWFARPGQFREQHGGKTGG